MRRLHTMTQENLPDDAHDRCRDEGAEDAVDTFRLALVHELRAPLQVLQGQLEGLAGDAGDGVRVDTMREALDVLARVVDDVLQLGQGGEMQLPLAAEPFEVRASVDGEVTFFAATAQAKGLALHCDIDDELPVMLVGDATRLRQILRVLLANALKYTDAGAVHVRVSWRTAQAQLILDVADTGPGIPAEAQKAIFRAFFRAHQDSAGTGLGLWIARRWAHRMGGVLVAESPVSGAHFRLTLPLPPLAPPLPLSLHLPPTPLLSAHALPAVPIAVRQGLRVLVVDDHPINRLALCDQLTALGCAAQGVEDATAALAHWASGEVDAVLTDLQLGHTSGLTLAAELRELAAALHREAPVVIAVTGSVIDARSARDAGIDTVLTKPVSRERLGRVLSVHWPHTGRPAPDADPSPLDAALALERQREARLSLRELPGRGGAMPQLRDDAHARQIMRREMANDLASFRRLLRRQREGDIDAAQLLLHRMQGACRMFGDPALLKRCAALAVKLAAHRAKP